MTSLLAPTTWDSKSALLAHMEAHGPRTIVVGLNAEAPRAYCSFTVPSSRGPGEIGVIASGPGTKAGAVLMDSGRRAMIGHDSWVTWVDVEALAVVTARRLGGVFFEFLPVERQEEVVVLHELGALRVGADGMVKWSVDTDVVEDSNADAKGNLILRLMEGPRLVVALDSGAVSRRDPR